jgi:hypothetical protein
MSNELIKVESEVKTLMSRLPRKGSVFPALILIDTIISELENKGIFIDNRDFFIVKDFRKECSTDKNFKNNLLGLEI